MAKKAKVEKRQQPLRKLVLYDDIYDVEYIVLMGDYEVADAWHRKKFDGRVLMEPGTFGGSNANNTACCTLQHLHEEINLVILWFHPKIQKKSAAARVGYVAHECLHAIVAVLEQRGIPNCDRAIDEVYAYYLEWLIWHTVAFVCKDLA